MKDIQLSLTLDEVNAILATLGNLPTQSGAWPLLQKIKAQAEACVAQPAQDEEFLIK